VPAGEEGQQQGAKARALKLSNFGIHFWPKIIAVKHFKCGIGGYYQDDEVATCSRNTHFSFFLRQIEIF
jgi:hypothetical protein